MIKKNIYIAILLCILIIFWRGTGGYREIVSKTKDVIKIVIYDKKLFYQLHRRDENTGEFISSTAEAIEKSKIITVNGKEINELLNCFHPRLFSFELLNCRCTGDYSLEFENKDGTKYTFALAHKETLKTSKYGDWPIGNEIDLWIQNKLLSKPK